MLTAADLLAGLLTKNYMIIIVVLAIGVKRGGYKNVRTPQPAPQFIVLYVNILLLMLLVTCARECVKRRARKKEARNFKDPNKTKPTTC